MAPEAVVAMLVAAVVSLAGAISMLWMMVFKPLITKMMNLIDVIANDFPKQTEAVRTQTDVLKDAKAVALIGVKKTEEVREKLSEIHEELRANGKRCDAVAVEVRDTKKKTQINPELT